MRPHAARLNPNNRWNRLSLRQQLVLSLCLCTIPVSAAGTTLVLRQAYQSLEREARQDNAYSLANLAQVMNDYLGDNQAFLRQLAEGQSLRNLDPDLSQELMDRAKISAPNMRLSVFQLDGTLVASNADPAPATVGAEAEQRRRSNWFQGALQNRRGLVLSEHRKGQNACLIQAEAVRTQEGPIGVLQACITPENVGANSGISDLMDARDSGDQRTAWIDLDQGIKSGRGILLVSKRGQLLLLHKRGNNVTGNGRLINPRTLQKTAWADLTHAIQTLPSKSAKATQSEVGDYFVATSALGPDFKLAAIVDKKSALHTLRDVAISILSINVLALMISSVAVARVSKTLLKPIDQVGDALRRISDGDFAITLPCSTNNDISRLFTHITTSAQKLKTFVAEATKNAVNNAQISEAKRLQADFLIEQLPETAELEIAALCQPAYDIGADWYDAIALGEARAVVVADVCDKGIPSALYMSVFRSLLRLSLEKEWQSSHSCGSSIAAAVSTVNRYMAETHGHTGMFATAFVAVVEPRQQTLTYLLAGHEPPLLMSTADQSVRSLELSGPALGLFPQASFRIHSCPLRPGDLLLAFSDGLPDGRNPAGEAFGHGRIQQLLSDLSASECSARALLDQVRSALAQHCQDSEPFDDLTLLALKHRATP